MERDYTQDAQLKRLVEKAMLLNLNENAYRSGLIEENERNRIILRINTDYSEVGCR